MNWRIGKVVVVVVSIRGMVDGPKTIPDHYTTQDCWVVVMVRDMVAGFKRMPKACLRLAIEGKVR